MTRSQIEFAFGLATDDRNTSTPRALIESSRLLCEDPIPIMDPILVAVICLRPAVASRPHSVRGHGHVGQTARTVLNDNEHVQHLKRGSDSNEEVVQCGLAAALSLRSGVLFGPRQTTQPLSAPLAETGRPGWHRKAEQSLAVDVRRIASKGLLAPGLSFSWHWTTNYGDRAGGIGVRVAGDPERVILNYAWKAT